MRNGSIFQRLPVAPKRFGLAAGRMIVRIQNEHCNIGAADLMALFGDFDDVEGQAHQILEVVNVIVRERGIESNLANQAGVLFNLACSISKLSVVLPAFPAPACTAGIAST